MFAKIKRKPLGLSFWLLLLFLLLFVFDKFLNYQGHYAFDDMAYASLANDLLNGDFSMSQTHYSFRWALIFPLAFFYKLFGINDFASSLPAFLSFVSISFIIYLIFKKEKNWLIVFGLILFSIQKWNYNYLDKIMPDILVSLGFISSLYCLHRLYFGGIKNKFLPLFFSASILLAFTAKETILILFPLYLAIFLIDLYKKKNIGFWGLSIFSGIFFGVVYFISIYFITGNAFERFVQIDLNSYENPCSYDLLPRSHTWKRISSDLVLEWIKSGLLIWVGISLLIFFSQLRKHYFSFKHPWQFWSFCLIGTLMCSNFMSISFKSYVPLCPDPRHFIFLAPVVSVCTVFAVRYFMRKRYTSDLFFLVIVNIFFCFNLLFFYGEKVIPFLLILCTSLIAMLRYAKVIYRNHTLVLGLIVIYFFTLFGKGNEGYQNQKKFIQKEIINKIDDGIIFTNNAQSRLANYQLKFDQSQLAFLSYDEINTYDNSKKAYVLLNAFTCELNGTPWEKLPEFVKQHRLKENEIAKDQFSRLYLLDEQIMVEFPNPPPKKQD